MEFFFVADPICYQNKLVWRANWWPVIEYSDIVKCCDLNLPAVEEPGDFISTAWGHKGGITMQCRQSESTGVELETQTAPQTWKSLVYPLISFICYENKLGPDGEASEYSSISNPTPVHAWVGKWVVRTKDIKKLPLLEQIGGWWLREDKLAAKKKRVSEKYNYG